MPAETRCATVASKVRPSTRRRVMAAAELEGVTMSSFLAGAAEVRARQVLREAAQEDEAEAS